MFVDDVCDNFPLLYGNRLAESTFFKINEFSYRYAVDAQLMVPGYNIKKRYRISPFPQLLPYNNICILFNDELLWSIQEDTTIKDYQNNKIFPAKIIYYWSGNKKYLLEHKNEISKLYVIHRAIISIGDLQVSNENTESYDEQTLSNKDIKMDQQSGLLSLYRFLSILSCKNIRKKKIQISEAIQKKRIKNKKHPLLEYYVLELKNISSDSQKLPAKDLWSNRIHFCRGHMKTYTKERPLFGSIVGRYWWPPHVRGKKEKGIIVKDYQIPK